MSEMSMRQPLDEFETPDPDTLDKAALGNAASAGEMLSLARQQKDWSVQQVAEQLKLSVKQITALEGNQFDALPQMVIVRGFVRAYAKLLKIDSDVVVRLLPEGTGKIEFDASLKPALATPFFESRMSLMGRQDNSRKYLISAALLAIFAMAFYAWQKVEKTDFVKAFFPAGETVTHQVAAPDLQQVNTPLPVAAPTTQLPGVGAAVLPESPGDADTLVAPKGRDAEAGSSTVIIPAASSLQATAAAPSATTNSAGSVPVAAANDEMKLTFSQDVWLQIKRENGTVVTSHLAKAGTQEIFSVSEPMQIRIGNAAGVQALLRGAPLAISDGSGSNVVNLNVK
jgi:cytoskeleton protein RodZ